DVHILTFEVAGLFQTLAECGDKMGRLIWRPAAQKADHRHRRLLSARRDRPRRRRAAEKRDEFAAIHSITSSESANNLSGTWRLSALAVLTLMINSIFVFCWTGRSAGFSPLRMRPA